MSLPVSLPEGFVALVKEGDSVTKGQVIAEKSPEEEVINIPQQLHIPLDKVKNVLKKNPGDEVNVGDEIAVKNGFWGGDTAIISNVNGVVDRYERMTGNLVIKKAAEDSENAKNVISPVAGVVGLCNNDTIVVETAASTSDVAEEKIEEPAASVREDFSELKEVSRSIQGVKGVGGSAEGEVFVLEESFSEQEQDLIYALDRRTIDTIVVGDKFTKEMFVKGSSIGVAGFAGTNIDQEDFEYLENKKMSLPVVEVDEDSLKQLVAWKGKTVRIEGEEKVIKLL